METIRLLIIVVVVALIINIQWLPSILALCKICQENGAACMNLTTYHLCFRDNLTNTTLLLTCPEGTVCSDLPNICSPAATHPASCGDTSSCSVCNNVQVFACTSRTTFAFCFGASRPTDVLGSCPPNTFCDATTQDICVLENELHENSIICDRDAHDLA